MKIDCRCSMLLKKATCCSCEAELEPGTLIRAKPIEGSAGSRIQCGPCAANELLPLFAQEEAKSRAAFAAEESFAAEMAFKQKAINILHASQPS